ncbi:MAG: hypothetical protein AAGK97_12945 [Bacteroidota bacterium]
MKADLQAMLCEFKTSFLVEMKKTIHDEIEEKLKNMVDKKVAEAKTSIEGKLNDELNIKMAQLMEVHSEKVSKLDSTIGELQDYSRRENLVFHNVPYQLPENSWP